MSAFTHQVGDGIGSFTEVVEDEQLAALLRAGEPVTFRVPQGGDEWDAEFKVRTIKRAEIVTSS